MRYTYRRGRERIKDVSPKTEGEKQLEKPRHRCKDDNKKRIKNWLRDCRMESPGSR